ncbi:MAG: TIGR00730 family Rossman fold protein [Bacteroidales bacterium]|nr:TIGR00730 family Rossman fold protein [Bacteroidales bacterium]
MRVCVFASSSSILHEIYARAASELGEVLALDGHEVIYGGGGIGLMGRLADEAMSSGGRVTGIIPQFMQDEGWGHTGISEMIVTEDMHNRKKTMFAMSEAVVALPGGIGTLEELTEAITLKQLGIYNGPIVILNTLGFYDLFLRMLEKMINENFLRPQHKDIWTVASTPSEALTQIKNYGGWIPNPRGIAKI